MNEHLDVVVIGAGLSGIGAGHYLKTHCPWARFAILEARERLGGTWDLFRYPGIRADSDMYTLGYAFRPWPGARAIADGPSILRYLEEAAAELGDRIRYHHGVTRLAWSSAQARWKLSLEGGQQLTAGFVFSCTGYYRYDRGYLPELPGRESFRGTLVHPQFWPPDLDYAGRRVVVLGSGATAITLVPALAEKAAQVTMLQRSPTYTVSMPSRDPLLEGLRRWLPARWSWPLARWYKALVTHLFWKLSRRFPRLVKELLLRRTARELPPGYDLTRHFSPAYDPWDQRLCLTPDGDFFRALREGRASVVTGRLQSFTETGLLLESGERLEADLVVTATGLELLFLGGMEVWVDGVRLDPSRLLVYRGVMLEGVPNLVVALGYTNASWTLKADLTCRYAVRLLAHLRRSGKRSCRPQNHRARPTDEPLMGLTSGYLERGRDLFPMQGSEDPWRVHQSYLYDYRSLGWDRLEDGELEFSP